MNYIKGDVVEMEAKSIEEYKVIYDYYKSKNLSKSVEKNRDDKTMREVNTMTKESFLNEAKSITSEAMNLSTSSDFGFSLIESRVKKFEKQLNFMFLKKYYNYLYPSSSRVPELPIYFTEEEVDILVKGIKLHEAKRRNKDTNSEMSRK